MDEQTKVRNTETTFGDLLDAAITHPGTVSAAYSAFHSYSMGNQMLAYMQCAERGIPIGPLASFGRWRDLGRHVLKGSKAIELCMPITMRRKGDDAAPAQADAAPATFTKFVFKRNWFVLAQTDGQPYVAPPLPDWDEARALAALDITRIPYALLDGNCQGYATGRTVAVSTIATHPEKTLLHEIAHVLLGHTTDEQTMADDDRTPRSLREVEAEAVAMLVSAVLSLPGMDDSRGYIQHWNATGGLIPEHNARRIYKATDQILKAGRPAAPVTQEAGI